MPKPSSLVGNVGVVSSAGPLIPPVPDEDVVFSGPPQAGWRFQKGLARNDRPAEVILRADGDQRTGGQAAHLQGGAGRSTPLLRHRRREAWASPTEIGSDADAMQKAAELAGIANYGLVDVNLEVQIEVIRELQPDPRTTGQRRRVRALSIPSTCLHRTTVAATQCWTHTQEAMAAACQDSRPCKDSCSTGQLSTNQEDPSAGVPLEHRPSEFLLPCTWEMLRKLVLLALLPGLRRRRFRDSILLLLPGDLRPTTPGGHPLRADNLAASPPGRLRGRARSPSEARPPAGGRHARQRVR